MSFLYLWNNEKNFVHKDYLDQLENVECIFQKVLGASVMRTKEVK